MNFQQVKINEEFVFNNVRWIKTGEKSADALEIERFKSFNPDTQVYLTTPLKEILPKNSGLCFQGIAVGEEFICNGGRFKKLDEKSFWFAE